MSFLWIKKYQYILINFFLLILLFLYSHFSLSNKYHEAIRTDLQKELKIISSIFAYRVNHLSHFCEEVEINSRITIISESGEVLCDSKFKSSNMENHLYRSEVREALNSNGNIVFVERESLTLGLKMLYGAVKVERKFKGPDKLDDKGRFYIVRLATSLDLTVNPWHREESSLAIILFLFLVFNLILGSSFSHKPYLNSILKIREVARKISKESFTSLETLNGEDENLEDVLLSLEKSLHNLKSHRELFCNLKSTFESILKTSPYLFLTLDKKMNLNFASSLFREKFFTSQSEDKGYSIMEIFRIREITDGVKLSLEKGRHIFLQDVKLLYREAKGLLVQKEGPFNILIYPIWEDDETRSSSLGVMIFIQDLQDKQSLIQMKSDFIQNFSHEVKTPLGQILGHVQLLNLKGEMVPLEKRKEYLTKIEMSIKRMNLLFNSLLNLSQIENDLRGSQNTLFSIEEVTENGLELIDVSNFRPDIIIKRSYPSEDFKMKGNKQLIEQLIANLVENSYKYSFEKGVIEILWEKHPTDQALVLTIKDEGIGMDPSYKEKIFDQFFQIDQLPSTPKKGYGIGLSLVKHIVLKHRGSIRVETGVNKGTKMIITFPQEVSV